MQLGVLISLSKNVESELKKISDNGFSGCQLCSSDVSLFTDETADIVNKACKKYGVKVTTFWCGWSGPAVWDFYEGPLTLGLVPEEYRWMRIKELMQGSDFAKKIGVVNVATHLGFIPETPNTAEYASLVCAVRHLAQYMKNNGQYFLLETGQETPVTMRRLIEDAGTGNIGINFDSANLILYGKANPLDALDVFGEYVRDMHAKDGCYPTDGKNLGKETPIGQGKVDFPKIIKKLKDIGYTGAVTIEREISGEEQLKDIIAAKKYLEGLM